MRGEFGLGLVEPEIGAGGPVEEFGVFTDLGDHTLKGIAAPWRLFEVTS